MDNRYPYSSYIKSPNQLGASPKGSTEALKKDIRILGDYVDVLTTGSSKAQSVKGPMGNKFFLATDTDCKDNKGVAHPRFIYVNNIPSTTLGGGLVPGVVQDVMYINPAKLFAAFSQSDVCRLVTMETRDISNIVQTESQYVLDDDLVGYPASWFPKGVHPINSPEPTSSSGSSGSSGSSKKKKKKKKENFTTESDLPEVVYYISVGIIGVYIILKMIEKPFFRKLIQLSKI